MNEMERMMSFFLACGRMERQIQKLKSLYMKEFALRGAELPVLLALASSREGLRMDAVCDQVGSDKSQISRSLKNLMEADLVEREYACGYKGRYRLSPSGWRAVGKLAASASGIFERAHDSIDEPSWQQFYGFINRLTAYMDDEIMQMERRSMPPGREKKK